MLSLHQYCETCARPASLQEFCCVLPRASTCLRLITWSKLIKLSQGPRLAMWSNSPKTCYLVKALSKLVKTHQTWLKLLFYRFYGLEILMLFFLRKFSVCWFFSICGFLSRVLLSCWVFFWAQSWWSLCQVWVSHVKSVSKIKLWQVIVWLNQMNSWSLLKFVQCA